MRVRDGDTFLCIGGELDGEKREYRGEAEFRHWVTDPKEPWSQGEVTKKIDVKTQIYCLEKLGFNGLYYAVWRLKGIPKDQILAILLGGYRKKSA